MANRTGSPSRPSSPFRSGPSYNPFACPSGSVARPGPQFMACPSGNGYARNMTLDREDIVLDGEVVQYSPLQNSHTRAINLEENSARGSKEGISATDDHSREGGEVQFREDVEDYAEIDLDEDVYGATIYSVVHDGYDIITGKDDDDLHYSVNLMRIVFVLFSLAVNYVMQFSLLYFSYFFVASPALARVQKIYKEYHIECFDDDGTYREDRWNAWSEDKRHQLCNIVFSNKFFLYCILCLWWMTCLNEFRKTEKMLRNFSKIATVNQEMVEKAEDDEIEKVVGFVPCVRPTLYLVLIVPKFLISICLLVLGSMWLSATDDFADLVLNAVALEFIILVDEIIFDAMFPSVIKNHLGNVKLMVERAAQTPEAIGQEMWDGFRRSWIYYAVLFLVVALYLEYGQRLPYIGVIPGYANDAACPVFWQERADRPCGLWSPLQGGDCFPYGAIGKALMEAEGGHYDTSGQSSHRR